MFASLLSHESLIVISINIIVTIPVLINIQYFSITYYYHTLSGRTGSALVWYSEGRRFAPHSVQ